MDIYTKAGRLNTATLPAEYYPCFCSSCGERVGWLNEELGCREFYGLCDECAAVLSQADIQEEPCKDL